MNITSKKFTAAILLLTQIAVVSEAGASDSQKQVSQSRNQTGCIKEIQKQRPHMDLAFCIDTTGSMQAEINQVKEKVKDMVAKLCAGKPAPVVRVGLVAFRDHGDEYVTKVFPFTDDVDKFVKDISALSAAGGGDAPEAVTEAIKVSVNQLNWDSSNKTAKLLFLIGDAGPHPHEKTTTWEDECRKAIARGIQINTIACDGLEAFPAERGTGFFKQVAKLTDGSFESLSYKQEIAKADGSRSTIIRSAGRSYEVADSAAASWREGAGALAATGKAKPMPSSISRAIPGGGGAGGGRGREAGAYLSAISPASAAISRKQNNLDSIMLRAAEKKSREVLKVDYSK